jgi:hypothetical protein
MNPSGVRPTWARAARALTRALDPWAWARLQSIRGGPFFGERRRRHRYAVLDEPALRATRRSDTVFVFGSGYSINEVTPEQWSLIAAHDTMSFNYFPHQRFVRADYHLVGELATGDDFRREAWEPALREYGALIAANPLYQRTVMLLQAGWSALQSNRLVALDLLRPGTRIFRYRRTARGRVRPPSASFAEGLVHGAATLVGCVNFAVLMGWREIVLAGVDLADSRYFWLPYDATRADMVGQFRHDEPYPMVPPLIAHLAGWVPLLAARGIRLSVYNPRSLLAGVMPVFSHDAARDLPSAAPVPQPSLG